MLTAHYGYTLKYTRVCCVVFFFSSRVHKATNVQARSYLLYQFIPVYQYSKSTSSILMTPPKRRHHHHHSFLSSNTVVCLSYHIFCCGCMGVVLCFVCYSSSSCSSTTPFPPPLSSHKNPPRLLACAPFHRGCRNRSALFK